MKKYLIILLAICTISMTSCQKWLDVNTDPNAVSEASNGLIVPAIELNLMSTYGLFGHCLGSYYAEYWSVKTGGPNCMTQAQWNTDASGVSSTMADNIYNYNYMRCLNNAKVVRQQAAAEGNVGDYLVGTVYYAFCYQMLVDAFGETPYTEALQPTITAPKYDDGKDVYAGVIAELEKAVKDAKEAPTASVCNNMLFLGSSDVNNYIQFANALLLRMYTRQSAVVDCKAKIKAIIEENNLPASDIAFDSSLFTNEAGKDNPFFAVYVRGIGNVAAGETKDICGHMALMGTMDDAGDARLKAKFLPSKKTGLYEGNFIDTQQSVEKTAGYVEETTFSDPVLNYNDPVYLITLAEIKFHIAEYYVMSSDMTKAKAFYEDGVKASFNQCESEDVDTYLAGKYAWNNAKALELIAMQEWFANAGVNGFEAWCEIRRTGYPAFYEKTGAQIYDAWLTACKAGARPSVVDLVDGGNYAYGTIFTPTKAEKIDANTMIGRLPYCTTSKNTNVNAPTNKEKGEKVFWAK